MINSLCSFACAHPSHIEGKSDSYCSLKAWHKGDHNFECTPHKDSYEKI